MMVFANLLFNEAKLQLIDMRQYWFETVGGLLFMTFIFLGLFYGIEMFAQPGTQAVEGAATLDGLVFGFIMWTFASGMYNSVTRTIIEDTQKGYIEQLFLCPSGFVSILLAKVLVDSLYSVVIVIVMAYGVMLLSGNWLTIDFVRFFAIMFAAAPSLIGLGFLMCGLTLVFKRIETVSALMNFALIAIVSVDALPFNLFSLLPFAAGNSLARDWVLQSLSLNTEHLFLVLIISAVYFVVGLLCLRLFIKVAKTRNLIGQY
jgi:ABC-2 type transport system permease protein